MGTSYSCNGRYPNKVLRFQSSTRRRTRRSGCTCMFKRPAWLRIRRKTHRPKCSCTKNSQVTFNEKPSANIICCPTENCNYFYYNSKSYCSRGTETCFCEMNLSTGDITSHGKIEKNVCRFTVDAYFT